MKSSNNPPQVRNSAAFWQPDELCDPTPKEPMPSVEEILAIFKGSLPLRPAGGPSGSSSLVHAYYGAASQAWVPQALPPFQPQVKAAPLAEVKAPVKEQPAAQRASDTLAFETAREKSKQMLAEAAASQAEALQVLADAQQQAKQLIEAATLEADQRLQQAYEQGKAQAEAELASAIQSAQASITETANWRAEMLAQSETAVIDMVKDMARILFSNGILVDPAVLQDTFTKVLMRARSLGNLRIFVHPDDALHIDPAWRDFQVTVSAQRIQIIPTESVGPGGCFIEGDQGTVDARIETRLEAVLNVFENQAA
jgi:flagellar biosynthesis/type III secretory pathway protein FliH